jgi:hypothetical protein
MHTNESNSTNRKTTATARTRARHATSEATIARPGDDQIRARAYEIYLRRDGRPGDPADDWFCAERELIERVPAQAAPAKRTRKAARS